jgi:hypothetical protein
MSTGELVTHAGGSVASAKGLALLLRELQARNRSGNYVLLNLNEVGISGCHSEDRIEMRIVLKKDGNA